jgi:hypothetical protein
MKKANRKLLSDFKKAFGNQFRVVDVNGEKPEE